MILTAPVEDVNPSAEGYLWYPYVPSLKLHVLGYDLLSLSLSGAGHPELCRFGYIE
jgi:hypothetical protein